MNNPAPREPSMDEILSSIRQIIAEDDASSRKAPSSTPPPPATVTPLHPQPSPEVARMQGPAEPLELSVEQIVDVASPDPSSPEVDAAAVDWAADVQSESSDAAALVGQGYTEADLVEAEDVSFEGDPDPEPEPVVAAEPPPAAPEPPPRPARPAAPVSRAAPMPDPTLSSDIAEQLLRPATDAAVRHTFARLGNLALANPGLTVEDMMRDMLRPLLKEWLDENLPAVVERMVEREIARISRGIE
jgi:cell pole-organizing protein PopZ